MTPNSHQHVCKNTTFPRATPKMKNCVSTAQAAADQGSDDPGNHEHIRKNDLQATTPHTLVFLWKRCKKCANMVTKNETFGVGKPTFVYILHLWAQNGSDGVPKAAQGWPWCSKWSPKGLKRVRNGAQSCAKLENRSPKGLKSVRQWSPKVAQSSKTVSKNNKEMLLISQKTNQRNKTKTGKTNGASPASTAPPTPHNPHP